MSAFPFCRKLQQFRREFEQAKNVAHLMLERESIGEVRNSEDDVIDVDRNRCGVIDGVYIGERYFCGGDERSWMFFV
jgi:hypothetical protein